MNFQAAVNQYTAGASATTAALQAHLLAVVWPGAAPQVNIGVDGTIAAGGVRPHYDSATNTIAIQHNGATPEDILDNILFEVNNALNPKIAAAAALSKATPVGDLGDEKIAAEYDTLKLYVRDLATIFAGGNPNNFPGLVGGAHALPTQALATINGWIANYAPIYAGYNVAGAAAFVVQPIAAIMPLPAVAVAPAGAAPQPIPAEQAAILQFGTTIHNPGAPAAGEQFYLALLTSKRVYGYELVREWNVSQLTTYVKSIGGAFANVMADNRVKALKAAWEGERRFRPYLFVELMGLMPAMAPAGVVGAQFQFDLVMSQVALTEASRAVSDRWDLGDLSKVKPVAPWLQPGLALRNSVDALRLGAMPVKPAIVLSRIR
ncbi:hypothetical protein Cs7R123_00950 [Catellatospora sp. TT07R-123]|uniref:hypothetical protein n=1 Tax=Catellatospora sp. TT07R-123 TaxID=2733863 RepID=UPI001B00410B|nr:hypothetical protein [Catellatospora sp. TT07R-123]GHJ42753.1 hypothetical protein Cs7R123_00950 [Catellatospora sp. TT07R-123]